MEPGQAEPCGPLPQLSFLGSFTTCQFFTCSRGSFLPHSGVPPRTTILLKSFTPMSPPSTVSMEWIIDHDKSLDFQVIFPNLDKSALIQTFFLLDLKEEVTPFLYSSSLPVYFRAWLLHCFHHYLIFSVSPLIRLPYVGGKDICSGLTCLKVSPCFFFYHESPCFFFYLLPSTYC